MSNTRKCQWFLLCFFHALSGNLPASTMAGLLLEQTESTFSTLLVVQSSFSYVKVLMMLTRAWGPPLARMISYNKTRQFTFRRAPSCCQSSRCEELCGKTNQWQCTDASSDAPIPCSLGCRRPGSAGSQWWWPGTSRWCLTTEPPSSAVLLPGAQPSSLLPDATTGCGAWWWRRTKRCPLVSFGNATTKTYVMISTSWVLT